jgi:two-component system cell cycle sensor histidine kinase/response regulator CckA
VPERERPAATAPGGGTILVAEDSEGVRRLVVHVLTRCGYAVLEAATGEEALAIAERHGGPIRLLVTDVVLPGLNGREVAERLQVERKGLRVLFMSGYNEDAVLAAGVRQAAVDFLDKPFTPRQLEEKVEELLGAAPTAATT